MFIVGEKLWASFSNFSNFLQRIVGHHFQTFPTFCKEPTGYPVLDPTANEYISGSGWEIYVFSVCFKCFSVVLRIVLLFYVFICVVRL